MSQPPAHAAAAVPPATAGSGQPSDCCLVQRLQGGIGNQLFQVLAARQLARLCGASVAFDTGSYAGDSYGRASMLHRIAPQARTCRIGDLDPRTTRLLREADLPLPADGAMPAGFRLPEGISHLVLDGYWQDRRLVDAGDVAMLRGQLGAQLSGPAQAWAARIGAARHATAVHVRRHDYKHHGLCAERYYTDALAWLAARHGEVDVFVFSDEPNYTAHVLGGAGIAHHMVRSGDDLADLHLMSLCGRHVISNSSYSWWAAMLAGTNDVIYPAPWSYVHDASPHLCPPAWLRVDGAVERQVSPIEFTAALEREQARIQAMAAGSS